MGCFGRLEGVVQMIEHVEQGFMLVIHFADTDAPLPRPLARRGAQDRTGTRVGKRIVVPAGLLGGVHRGVGVREQRVDVCAIIWKNGDSGAGADTGLLGSEVDGRAQGANQPGCQQGRVLMTQYLGEDDHELVSSKAGKRVFPAYAGAESLRHGT